MTLIKKEEPSNKKKWLRELWSWSLSLGAAVIISITFQTYVYAQTEVHNVSMQNTLVAGQRLIEDRWSYRFHQPEYGDIVIINGPESELRLVKRVIALPGDTLDIREGYVYVNGQRVEESYVKGVTYKGSIELPIQLDEGQLFVMGDNRENSEDSRQMGPIALSSIEGKAVYRIWPIAVFGGLE